MQLRYCQDKWTFCTFGNFPIMMLKLYKFIGVMFPCDEIVPVLARAMERQRNLNIIFLQFLDI